MQTCKKCGNENPDNFLFCGLCGNDLSSLETISGKIDNSDIQKKETFEIDNAAQAVKPDGELLEKSQNNHPHKKGVAEYRRTCLQCGQVWYSLVSREKALANDSCCNSLQASCSYCGGEHKFAKASEHNAQIDDNELSRIQRCPKCGSTNFTVEVIEY